MTPSSTLFRFETGIKRGLPDVRGDAVARQLHRHLGIADLGVETRDVFTIDNPPPKEDCIRLQDEFTDSVIQVSGSPRLEAEPFDWILVIGFRPGVTDNVGRSARSACLSLTDRASDDPVSIHTSTVYIFRGDGLHAGMIERIGYDFLANPLIETIDVYGWDDWQAGRPEAFVPRMDTDESIQIRRYDLSGSDEDLLGISREGTLALSLDEMRAIRDYFADAGVCEIRRSKGLDHQPTDVELEMLAQTWSEHCKHKIFAADIDYIDETGRQDVIHGLFKTYIREATEHVGRRVPWLVSVFVDDAGVVEFNEKYDLAFKVETHNSPSALEPYGGAMTGIVGCNRDLLGTGLSSEIMANVWGYCFASPSTPDNSVPEGVLHPARLRDNVHKGVIDGGNQSGIPYATGWEFFDDRYQAKPLVYCGSVGILPRNLPDGRRSGTPKKPNSGDHVVMIGGRIGKDGIHGATFSSEELHGASPVQAVQIGDPITQKRMSDFLVEARDAGLYSAITDNGAGGLSSSVGEMAAGCGGVEIELKNAPLKYTGLQPWEIWLSEAQERMSLAVPSDKLDALENLARCRDVELSVLGRFNSSGYLHLRYDGETVGWVDMDFLHDGCPKMRLKAVWRPPYYPAPDWPDDHRLGDSLRGLLGRLNIGSKEQKCRQYDHEVQGRTIIKPFVGKRRDIPSDATVMLVDHASEDGVVISRALHPHLADLDTYHATACSLDEAVRRIVAVGGRHDRVAALDNFCWPDPVLSPLPPDGSYKLAQLVRANQALYDTCIALDLPLISGKDSMKNDSTRSGKKISIPPTLLISAISRTDDVRRCVTLEAKMAGDVVYVVGITRAELGGSELAWMLNDREVVNDPGISRYPGDRDTPPRIGGEVPKLQVELARDIYSAVEAAISGGVLRSVHAPGLGGLATGLAMIAMGGEFGLDLYTENIPVQRGDGEISIAGKGGLSHTEILFSESPARFILTVDPLHVERLENLLRHVPHGAVGYVSDHGRLKFVDNELKVLVDESVIELKNTWKNSLPDKV